MLQIINRRFQLKIFDFTLSQQTIFKLFVFILTLKSQHHKNEAKIICKAGTFYKGKIIYFYPLTPPVLTVTGKAMINGNFICQTFLRLKINRLCNLRCNLKRIAFTNLKVSCRDINKCIYLFIKAP